MGKRIIIVLLMLIATTRNPVSAMNSEYLRALKLKADRHYLQSLDILKQAIQKDANFTNAYTQIEKISEANGQTAEAENYFKTLLRKTQPNGLAYYGLGLVKEYNYKKYKRDAEAIEGLDYFSKALASHPDVPEIYLHYANLSFRVNALDEAEQVCKRVVRQYPHRSAPHFGLGYVYLLRADWKRARNFIEKTLKLDPTSLAAYNISGVIYNATGEIKPALRALEAGERLAVKRGDQEYRAIFQREIGNSYSKAGNYPTALRHFESALAIYKELGDNEGEGESLSYIGRAYRFMGDHNKSLDFSLRALIMNRNVFNESLQSFSLNEIGLAYCGLGNPQKGLENVQLAFKLCDSLHDKSFKGALLNNLGIIYSGLDANRKALDYLEQALSIHREISNHTEEIINLGNIGSIHRILGDYSKALEYFLESLRIAQSVGDRDSQAILYKLIGNTYVDLGESQKALGYFNRTLKSVQEIGNKRNLIETLNSIGVAYLKLEEYPRALEHFKRALELATQVNFGAAIGYTHVALAKVYDKLGQWENSLNHYEQAIKVTESARSYLRMAEHKSGFFGSRIEAYQGAADILCRLNRTEEAFSYAEKARARAFLDMLAESKIDSYQGVDAGLIERERKLNGNISKIQKELGKVNEKPKRDALYKDLLVEEARLEDLKFEVRQKNPNYAHIQYPEVYNLKQVQRVLIPGSVLLEYMLGEEGSYLWALTQDQFRAFKLPKKAEIEDKVTKYRDFILSRSGGEDFGLELYEMLIKPAEPILAGKKSIVVVPDGKLHYLPFEALAKPIANKSNGGKNSIISNFDSTYLVEDYQLAYTPSATVLGLMRKERPTDDHRKTIIAFGDPSFANDAGTESGQQTRGLRETIGHKFSKLKYSREEIREIGDLFSNREKDLYTGPQATEENVKSVALSNYKIIHFATHALLDEEVPARSAILLTDSGDKEDGFLQMREVFNLKLNADLVVLSSCETGLGKLIRGEGLVGTTRAFMYAGAKSVLASLWKVDDRSTAKLMQRFYYYLKQGNTKSEALRKAKIEMINSTAYQNPYFWSGFVLQGEPWAAVTERTPMNYTILFTPLLIVAILFFVVLNKERGTIAFIKKFRNRWIKGLH